MFPVRRIPWLVAIVSLLALVVAVAGPAGAATGSVQLAPRAKSVALGVAVDVPVTVSLICDEGFDSGIVDVFVQQSRDNTLVVGESQSAPFACTGETQNVTVRVGGSGVFRPGLALANATVLECVGSGVNRTCSFTDISTSREIRILGGV
jgi:hypothetical protein